MNNKNIRTNIAFIGIILVFFMAMLDTTIVNIGLPKITDYFNSNVQDITWIANGYNISFAVLILVASRIADQFGRKKIFLIGLAAFTFTSCLAGFSVSLKMLIIIRIIQGISAAIVVPITIPLVIDIFPKEKHGAIIGIWGAIAGLGAACGPVLGGILIQHFNWQSIFFINLPFGIIAFIISIILLKESYDKTASCYIDFPGIISISTAMLTLTLGIVQAPTKGWNSLYIITLFVVATVSLLVFVVVEIKSKDPMLPMWLMRIWSFSAASTTLAFMTAGMMGGSFLVAFLLTKIMGLNSWAAGSTMVAMPCAMMVFSLIAGPISAKIGCRLFGVLGMSLMAFSTYLFSGITADSTRWDVMWRLIISGAAVGMTMSPLIGAAVRNVPQEKVGIVSGVTNVARTFGMVIGISVLSTLLSNNLNTEMELGKQKAIEVINSDNTINYELKHNIIYQIQEGSISIDSKPVSREQVIDVVNKSEENSLMETNDAEKSQVIEAFDKQLDEINGKWDIVEGDFNSSIYLSFSKTFRIFSILLSCGIIIAFFSDKFVKTKESV